MQSGGLGPAAVRQGTWWWASPKWKPEVSRKAIRKDDVTVFWPARFETVRLLGRQSPPQK